MRASGAFAAEHILTALAMSPAKMHFCIVARNTSLLMEAPKRYSDLSTMNPIVMMDQKRITYIPQPPSLKCFHTAAIEHPPLERAFFLARLRAPPAKRDSARATLTERLRIMQAAHVKKPERPLQRGQVD